jgi:hypothetical protein
MFLGFSGEYSVPLHCHVPVDNLLIRFISKCILVHPTKQNKKQKQTT